MRILAAQEDRGKEDGINVFGNGLGLREQSTCSYSPIWAVTALETFEIHELLSCSPMPPFSQPQRTTSLITKQYLMCV